MADVKRVYTFGNKEAEGNGKMRELLGGKGANLAEMNLIGIPVPPGFTITTEVCAEYYAHGKEAVIKMLRPEVERAMQNIEKLTGMKFGDKEMPLLVSVRSGARASMPGMMDTILNLGMNDQAVEAVAKRTGNPRFAWDSYRRFVQMYGDVVLGMKPESKEDHDPFEVIIEEQKEKRGVKNDTDLTTDDLKELVQNFKAAVKKQTGEDFPACPWDQLWGAVCAVFGSWMNERAILYRKLNNIPAEWGTAVTVQAMVFGNMGANSATGVAFSRDAATGENLFNGEYLINAQGEDVVAGIRTRSRSPSKARSAGPWPRTSPRRSAARNTLRSKRSCRRFTRSWMRFSATWNSTSRTCRTSNSRFRTASCGCCSAATASAPAPPWSRSRWTCSAKV